MDKLRLSVEHGIVEYKRSTLSPVLVVLEAVRYKSVEGGDLLEQEHSLTELLVVVLVQRLVALGIIAPAKVEEKRDFPVADMQVNVILSDVNARVKVNPALRSHTAVKNIIMQVQLYNKENRKLKELLPTIKPEMRASFLKNFIGSFSDITGSIRRNYLSLLQEESATSAPSEGFSLGQMPLKDLAPLLTNQAKEFSRVRSTLCHAREEKFGTREILVGLYNSRHEAIRLIEQESAAYRVMCKQDEACVAGIADGFRVEVASMLERQIRGEPTASST